LSVYSV